MVKNDYQMQQGDYWFEKFKEMMDADAENPNGYFNRLKKQDEIKNKRFDKFEQWLETNEFEPFFQKLLLRNGKERADWCWKRGIEKYGTPMMEFLTEFISERRSEIIDITIPNDFQHGLWYFKGYYFQLLCGQGCFWRIYDKNKKFVEDV
jgi:hypothetical protein